MKVIITRATFLNGKLVEPNKDKKPIEVSKADGKLLISLKKAVAVAEKKDD